MNEKVPVSFEAELVNRIANHLCEPETILAELELPRSNDVNSVELQREIEQVLRHRPALAEVAVLIRDGDESPPRLIVCVVPVHSDAAGAPLSIGMVQEYLRESIPAGWDVRVVILDAIPRTSEGDVDAALVGNALHASGLERSGPRTPTQSSVFEIWAELLGFRDFGVDEDFFGLGGDSLLATQMLSRIYDTFGVELPLDLIFTDSCTVSKLTESIEDLIIAHAGPEQTEAILREVRITGIGRKPD